MKYSVTINLLRPPNPAALLEGAQELVGVGCEALAVVTRFPEPGDSGDCGERPNLTLVRLGSGHGDLT